MRIRDLENIADDMCANDALGDLTIGLLREMDDYQLRMWLCRNRSARDVKMFHERAGNVEVFA